MKEFVGKSFLDLVVFWKIFSWVLISLKSDHQVGSYEFVKINREVWENLFWWTCNGCPTQGIG